MEQEKQLTEKESLDLIAQMINKAKDACHDTGMAAIMWGAVIAICSLTRLAELHFNFRLPFNIYWLTVVAIIPQVYISVKENKERRVKSYGDVFISYLWISFGICIFLLSYITGSMADALRPVTEELKNTDSSPSVFILYEFISSFFLMLYGLPTFVTGVSMKFKPMFFGGLLCWVCCIIALYTTVKIDLLLVAVSAIFAWLVPGIIMEKDYRKAKRGLAQANV